MARRKDENWNLPESNLCYDAAQLAVLMDIRDELKAINQVLHCSAFLGIPHKLDRIARNTAKKRGKKRRG